MATIIFGNGAMARIAYAYARHDQEIAGFTVDDACIAAGETHFCGLPLVPFSKVTQHFPPARYQMLIAIGFLEMNGLRLRRYAEASARGYRFSRYVHPSVMLHDDLVIGDNSIILDHVSIHPGSQIGHSCFISSNVNLGHDCQLAPGNWINSGVAIAGGCQIGEGCFFGVNASVANDLKVGARNFIAANTLLNKSTVADQVFISEPGLLFRMQSTEFLKFSRMLSRAPAPSESVSQALAVEG